MQLPGIKLLAVTTFILLLTLPLFSTSAPSLDRHRSGDQKNSIEALRRDVSKISEDVIIIRRDEINYALEKNILKEAYGASLSSTNTTISIAGMAIGIFFAILGYLGFSSIRTLKSDYEKELDSVRLLKSGLEVEILTLQKKQAQAEKDIARLSNAQSTKIEMLELVEKASGLANNGNYMWAIEHLRIALETDPAYVPALGLSAVCHARLQRYVEAEEIYRKLLSITPSDENQITNLAEMLLISKNILQYDILYEKYRTIIDEKHGGALICFFNTLRFIQLDDLANAKAIMENFINESKFLSGPKLGTWVFNEAISLCATLLVGGNRIFLENSISYFSGHTTAEIMMSIIKPVDIVTPSPRPE